MTITIETSVKTGGTLKTSSVKDIDTALPDVGVGEVWIRSSEFRAEMCVLFKDGIALVQVFDDRAPAGGIYVKSDSLDGEIDFVAHGERLPMALANTVSVADARRVASEFALSGQRSAGEWLDL